MPRDVLMLSSSGALFVPLILVLKRNSRAAWLVILSMDLSPRWLRNNIFYMHGCHTSGLITSPSSEVSDSVPLIA